MSISFIFPEGMENFYAAYGYAEIQVVDGRLELEHEPDGALLHLIRQYGGQQEEQSKPIKQDKPMEANE